MPAPKRTSTQREYDLERISDLYLQGKRQVDIAEAIGVSQGQVSYDLAEIQRRWRAQTVRNLDEDKARELARIDALERTYWAAWARSCGERTKQRTSKNDVGISQASIERESMLGNPAYLAGVQWCISERCKLLGIYAPVRQALEGTVQVEDAALSDDERMARFVALFDRARARRDGQAAGDDAALLGGGAAEPAAT